MSIHLRSLTAASMLLAVMAASMIAPALARAAPASGGAGSLLSARSVRGVEVGSRGATLSVDVAGNTRHVAVDLASFMPAGIAGSFGEGEQGRAVVGALTLGLIILVFGWFRRMVTVFVRLGHGPAH